MLEEGDIVGLSVRLVVGDMVGLVKYCPEGRCHRRFCIDGGIYCGANSGAHCEI